MPSVFNTIHPKLVSIPAVRGYILNAQREAMEDIVRDMAQTTRSWHHQPVFQRIMGYRGGGTFIHVFTDDEAWNYLDQGTSRRFAVMENNFQAKTKPGWIGSGAGSGKKKYMDMDAGRAAGRAIQARMWSAVIRTKNQPKYEKRIYDAIVKGLTV